MSVKLVNILDKRTRVATGREIGRDSTYEVVVENEDTSS